MAFLLLEAAAGLTALFGIKKKERRKSIFTFAMASTKKKLHFTSQEHFLYKSIHCLRHKIESARG